MVYLVDESKQSNKNKNRPVIKTLLTIKYPQPRIPTATLLCSIKKITAVRLFIEEFEREPFCMCKFFVIEMRMIEMRDNQRSAFLLCVN